MLEKKTHAHMHMQMHTVSQKEKKLTSLQVNIT